ncbi:uncharacterized protein LOC129759854 [Uranotaenia lowii]|uniref:uncharacterized protein LOC129759854 n=1 Tax=Uranotaenia lowii TaxID=190385 RepID=UPI002479AA78|nr:uncharacterized protein LOC129759854 [Uranotaenia lowii]
MVGVDFDALNEKIRKRLQRVDQDPLSTRQDKLRLLKRYFSHFVKLVKYGRIFERSFEDHVCLIVEYTTNRCDQPIEISVLSNIVKTFCVVCSISDVAHQIVIISLRGLLDIFERISCKETLEVLKDSQGHFKKLISQFKRFGHYDIQRLFIELIFSTSLSYGSADERKNYVLKLGAVIGRDFEWDTILQWKKSRLSQECRKFLMNVQGRSTDRDLTFYSVPIVHCKGDDCSMVSERGTELWLDFNFRPATISFSGMLSVTKTQTGARNELWLKLEILQSHINSIALIEESIKEYLLEIEYEEISVDPPAVPKRAKGKLTFKLGKGFDKDRFNREILKDVRTNAEAEQEDQFVHNLDSLQNISLLDSLMSEAIGPQNTNNFEQSPRLFDNRDAIEEHLNLRNQLMREGAHDDSNKENRAPNDLNLCENVSHNIQRLRVFEPLIEDCRNQQSGHQRVARQNKQRAATSKQVLKSPSKTTEKRPRRASLKKRNLFSKSVDEIELNSSKDSQLQRNKYIESKLVNAVKPLSADVHSDEENDIAENQRQLNNSSSSDAMSTDELERSLQAYIENNGVFGIVQQKILDKKLEKNIRKINEMVQRSTHRFFKTTESIPENPYDFHVSPDRKPKNKPAKAANTTTTKKKPRQPRKPKQDATLNKANKNNANSSRQKKKVQTPKTEEPVERRIPPSRAKKPVTFVTLSSESEASVGETNPVKILTCSQRNAEAKFFPRNRGNQITKALFAHSTPAGEELAQSPKRLKKTDNRKEGNPKSLAKPEQPTLKAAQQNVSSVEKKQPQKRRSSRIDVSQWLLNHEAEAVISDVASQSSGTQISISSPELRAFGKRKFSLLTESNVRLLQSAESEPSTTIHQSLEVNQSNDQKSIRQSPAKAKRPAPNREPLANVGRNASAKKRRTSLDSETMRVGNAGTCPPPTMDDNDELDLIGNSIKSMSTCYPELETIVADNRKPTKSQSTTKMAIRNVIVKTEQISPSYQPTMENGLDLSPRVMDEQIISQFKERLGNKLNPAIAELEKKAAKLDATPRLLARIQTEMNDNGFDEKLNEIESAERNLDRLYRELCAMGEEWIARSQQGKATVQKLRQYDESRRMYYFEQAKAALSEITEISDECAKTVWNERIRCRASEMEALFNEMMF